MKKNIFKTMRKSFAAIAIVSMLSLTACGGGDDNKIPEPRPTPENPTPPKPSDIAVTGISLDKTTLQLKVGDKSTLKATVTPSDATNPAVTWSTGSANIANVSSSGEVSGVSPGTTTITAKAGDKTATCSVEVTAENKPPVPASDLEVTMDGEIDHKTYTKGQKASVTFNRFPASLAEFKKVQEQIGGEPHGAIALELMAAEMYRRDRTLGTSCLELCNVSSNVKIQTDRWKEIFGSDKVYARPYQIAAFLKGANPDNDYTPNEPYKVDIEVNESNPYGKETFLYNSDILYLNVLTKGKDKGFEMVEVIKPGRCMDFPQGSTYFLVHNCPGLYSQVKQIYDTNWNKLK